MSSAIISDLGEAVADCSVEIEVSRPRKTPVINGRKQANGSVEKFTCMYSIQPMVGRELQQLPEGQRNSGRVKGYGSEELRTVQTSECRQPDTFCYRDVIYEVVKVEDWFDLGGYYRIEAERVTR